MLTRAASALALALGTALATVAPADSAHAAGDVSCPPNTVFCVVTVVDPGAPASTSGGSSAPSSGATARVCTVPGSTRTVPCTDPAYGWFNNADGCYYRLVDVQPAADHPIWQGSPAGGTVHSRQCPLAGGGSIPGGWVVLAGAPSGFGAVAITPADLAVRAVEMLELHGPAIGIAPPPGTTGLVGVPVWLWTEVTPATWGPATATASVPGLSVTATAQATRIVWDMGDGTTVTCRNPGTAYDRSFGGVQSPTCGHVYTTTSAGHPGDAFAVTATTTWDVSWTGGGASGVITVTRESATSVRIGELQVLIT